MQKTFIPLPSKGHWEGVKCYQCMGICDAVLFICISENIVRLLLRLHILECTQNTFIMTADRMNTGLDPYCLLLRLPKYRKTCLKRHSQKDKKLVFKTNYRLMQVKSIAECSAILSTFIKLSQVIRCLFCLF